MYIKRTHLIVAVPIVAETFSTSKLDLRSKPSISCNSEYLKIHPQNFEQINYSKYWLSGDDINAFQYILSDHRKNSPFGSLDGFQDVEKLSWEYPIGGTCNNKFVQILNVNKNHWITVSNVFSSDDNEVCVYDSKQSAKFPPQLQTLVSSFLRKPGFGFNLVNMLVQQQRGYNDCGLFACAYATSIVFNQNPVNVIYTQQSLRKHFTEIIKTNNLTVFPYTPKRASRYQTVRAIPYLVETYCICKLAALDQSMAMKMAECSERLEYYHDSCVDIPSNIWTNEQAKYICPSCYKKQ